MNIRRSHFLRLIAAAGGPGRSLQLLVNYDDGNREFAYQEPDHASLNAAAANGWQVISMKNDWKTIFAFQE